MQTPYRSYPAGTAPLVPPLWSLPQPVNTRPLVLGSGGMEIGGLLNARHVAAAADAQMRQHFQHPMQMDHRSYSMGQPQMQPLDSHQQQHQIQMSNGMTYQAMQPAQNQPQMYDSSYETREDSQDQTVDDDFGASRPKGEGAQKQFNCSTCPKAFARRSDLARHGQSRSQAVEVS